MKKCNFCNVLIKDETDYCPLCGSVLEGQENGHNTYPNVMKKEKAISLIFRIMLFVAIVSIFTCIGINITTHVSVKWSLIVAFSFLYALIILYMFAKEETGYRIRTFFICASGILLFMAIDYILGFHRWSVNYVFPTVIVAIDIALIVLMIVNYRNWQSYIIILLLMVLISIVPIIMYRLHIITNPYPTQVAFAFTLIITIGVLILGGPRVKSELYRRFHIMGK